jgi:hypothetical protein
MGGFEPRAIRPQLVNYGRIARPRLVCIKPCAGKSRADPGWLKLTRIDPPARGGRASSDRVGKPISRVRPIGGSLGSDPPARTDVQAVRAGKSRVRPNWLENVLDRTRPQVQAGRRAGSPVALVGNQPCKINGGWTRSASTRQRDFSHGSAVSVGENCRICLAGCENPIASVTLWLPLF